jgi:type I restriction enzyme M protein
VLANPPYSIKQWDRDAWSADPWGRNIYGTPPQGRADYAFWQHIISSLKPKTGRCAILFPHGVLFRNEEQTMREKLIAHDMLECVLGLGPNLFYNSPMEACVVICRTSKPKERRKKVLFINAVNEVTRERAQSFLTDGHITRISKAYRNFEDIDGFTKVASSDEVRAKGNNLSIPLYVRTEEALRVSEDGAEYGAESLKDAVDRWQESSGILRKSMSELFEALTDISTDKAKPQSKRTANAAFKRAVLAAEVTAQLYKEPTFGSVKQEKIIYLCEKHFGLTEELDHHHLRQAAGPYDPKAKRSIENNFIRQKWFDVKREAGKGVKYIPSTKFGGHTAYYERYFGDLCAGIDSIINLLRSFDTERCEIVATLYAAWSDFLKKGITPTDDQIVQDVLENWHESKQRIDKERWLRALQWMKEKKLVPTERPVIQGR